MGYSLSWMGVKDVSLHVVLEALALTRTGRRQEIPDSPLNGVNLPSGWYLVIANNKSPDFFADSALQRLSTDGELVTCFVEEHVMYSSATGWKGGRKVWSVLHDSQLDIEHLETAGDLPSNFSLIRDRLHASQEAAGGRSADVDYTFNVPVELAEARTGFRHDLGLPELGEDPFEVLLTTGCYPESSSRSS